MASSPDDPEAADELPDVDALGDEAEATIQERYAAKKPSPGVRDQMLAQHTGHLVRRTHSTYTVDADCDIEGMHVDAQIEVEDVYCFDCEGWVGISGIDLRGTPRSKTHAYHLGGIPDDVQAGRAAVRKHLGYMAEHVYREVDRVDSADAAFAFVGDELARVREEVADGE